MKKILALCLALMLIVSASAMAETIKIGIFEPASGDNGAGGKQETLGIRYANELCPTVEVGGVTYEIELYEVDNQTTADKAPSAAQTLVSQDVAVVLGTYGSGAAMAAAPIFEDAGVPAIGCSCTNPGVTLGNAMYWRICFTDPFQGEVMANFAASKLEAKTAYTLYQLGDDYSAGLVNYFTKAFEKLGGTIVAETFPEGNSDFSAYLANAVNAGADVIFSPSSTTAASLILGQAASMNLEIPFCAGDTWESSVILDAVKGTELKVYLSTFFDESDTEASTLAADFVSGFKAWLNANPYKMTNIGGNDIVAAVSALGYDAYMTAVEAIKLAGAVDAASIAAALPGVSLEGVTGLIEFDENGDAKKDIAYIKVADGEAYAFTFLTTTQIAK